MAIEIEGDLPVHSNKFYGEGGDESIPIERRIVVTGRMRSNRSGRVRLMANRNYGGNGSCAVKLDYGSLGGRTDYLQTWLQGADVRADARAALQFGKQVYRLS